MVVGAPGAPLDAIDEGMRLIQTAPGKSAWMTPAEIREIAIRSHADGHCGGFMDITEHPSKPARPNRNFFEVVGYPDPRHQDTVKDTLSLLSVQQLTDTVDHLSNHFKTRHLRSASGVQAAEWIKSRFLELANGRKDVSVELFKHKKFIQPSVIVRIHGYGPNGHERVILGAHEDSVNWKDGGPESERRAPGADDDASGVATLIETFRVLMATDFRPARTVEFMAYAGEELGLLGSQDIAEFYADQEYDVVGVQQFDMTFYPSSNPEISIIDDHTSDAMNKFTEKLLDTYVHAPWREEGCGYACSDHASWTDAGFASSFPFEVSMSHDNPKIHSTGDVLSILTPSHGMHFAKLAVAFAVELGNP
jgi:leucyl aminopeptidase